MIWTFENSERLQRNKVLSNNLVQNSSIDDSSAINLCICRLKAQNKHDHYSDVKLFACCSSISSYVCATCSTELIEQTQPIYIAKIFYFISKPKKSGRKIIYNSIKLSSLHAVGPPHQMTTEFSLPTAAAGIASDGCSFSSSWISVILGK